MFSQTTTLTVTCTKCGAARELPEADRPRWPATDGKAVTVTTDKPCRCGSKRVKLSVRIE